MPEEQPVISTVVLSMAAVLANAATPFKRAGKGVPPPHATVLCLLPYLKAPPPTSLRMPGAPCALIPVQVLR